MTALQAGMLARLRDRVYGDFLMGSRLGSYEQLIALALQADYQIRSVGAMWRLIAEDGLDPARRYLMLRHDVDTDPNTAAAMWAIDRQFGIETSYFFRLSTMAPPLMADISAHGGEASYHYEELSTVVKRRGLRSRSRTLSHIPEARDEFAENLARLRTVTGLPMRVVAAHGDFVNRHLGVPNQVILDDPRFRKAVGVDLEAYDEDLLRHLPCRHADAPPPRFWVPADPTAPIFDGEPVLSVLVHPRHWRVDRMVNARDDLKRAIEGIRFGLRLRPRAPA